MLHINIIRAFVRVRSLNQLAIITCVRDRYRSVWSTYPASVLWPDVLQRGSRDFRFAAASHISFIQLSEYVEGLRNDSYQITYVMVMQHIQDVLHVSRPRGLRFMTSFAIMICGTRTLEQIINILPTPSWLTNRLVVESSCSIHFQTPIINTGIFVPTRS